MIRYRFIDNVLNILISEEEKINLEEAKGLIKKGRRIIQQNNAENLVVELKKTNNIHENATNYFDRVVHCSTDFPITVLHT